MNNVKWKKNNEWRIIFLSMKVKENNDNEREIILPQWREMKKKCQRNETIEMEEKMKLKIIIMKKNERNEKKREKERNESNNGKWKNDGDKCQKWNEGEEEMTCPRIKENKGKAKKMMMKILYQNNN